MINTPHQWPSIYQRTYPSGRAKWVVDSGMVAGIRQRRGFDSLPEAKTHAERLRIERLNEGREALALSAVARQEAAACLLKLQPHGATLTEATVYYVDHVLRFRASPVLHELVAQLLQEKMETGRRPSSVRSLRGFCSLLDATFGSRRLHEISREELKLLCAEEGLAPRTVLNRIRLARQVWNHAISRGWAGENIAAKLVVPSQEDREPGYLSVADARRLVSLAGEFHLLGYVAIGLFAGIRSAELQRLDWACVHLEEREIVISGKAAKMRSRRVVTYDDTLAAWLALCPRRHGPIVDSRNLSRDLRQLRQAAGVQAWPHNALRHSFATYHLAQHQDPARTAYLLGHYFGSEMLTRHYRGLVSRADAADYWAIRPQSVVPRETAQPIPTEGEYRHASH